MTDKREQILDAAIKCFSEKGFQATSIQDIAESSEMAKGSLYFYFKSKEDILVSAIKRNFGLIRDGYLKLGQRSDLTSGERLEHRVRYRFEVVVEYRDFLSLLMQERFEKTAEIMEYFHQYGMVLLEEDVRSIEAHYGEAVKPHAFDVAVMMNSMINGYLGFIIAHRWELDSNQVAGYLLRRTDEIVSGLIEGRENPILKAREVKDYLQCEMDPATLAAGGPAAPIMTLRESAKTLELDGHLLEEILESLDLLEQELAKDQPKALLLKGMIAFLKGLKIPAFKSGIAELEQSLNT